MTQEKLTQTPKFVPIPREYINDVDVLVGNALNLTIKHGKRRQGKKYPMNHTLIQYTFKSELSYIGLVKITASFHLRDNGTSYPFQIKVSGKKKGDNTSVTIKFNSSQVYGDRNCFESNPLMDDDLFRIFRRNIIAVDAKMRGIPWIRRRPRMTI